MLCCPKHYSRQLSLWSTPQASAEIPSACLPPRRVLTYVRTWPCAHQVQCTCEGDHHSCSRTHPPTKGASGGDLTWTSGFGQESTRIKDSCVDDITSPAFPPPAQCLLASLASELLAASSSAAEPSSRGRRSFGLRPPRPTQSLRTATHIPSSTPGGGWYTQNDPMRRLTIFRDDEGASEIANSYSISWKSIRDHIRVSEIIQGYRRSYKDTGIIQEYQRLYKNIRDHTMVSELLQQYRRSHKSIGDHTRVSELTQEYRRLHKNIGDQRRVS